MDPPDGHAGSHWAGQLEELKRTGADCAISWDGDYDRCFLFDQTGRFIPGEYIVGLLAEVFLAKAYGAHGFEKTIAVFTASSASSFSGLTPRCR